jgi:hypothetical protein
LNVSRNAGAAGTNPGALVFGINVGVFVFPEPPAGNNDGEDQGICAFIEGANLFAIWNTI